MSGETEIQRIAMALEFNGRDFSGWQSQDNAPTVQACVESALASIEGNAVKTIAAGRTDAGVHAEALLVHADVNAARWKCSQRAYTHGVNSHLPDSIRVVGVRGVSTDFHARFDCLERVYRYQIWNRPTAPALQAWRHWWMPRALDINAMQQAGRLLLGEHDFGAFRAAGCQAASAVRELRQLDIEQQDYCVLIHVRADAFLYHMVRNMVGNLVQVGIGSWPPEQISILLDSKDRTCGAATAPAHGLYFTDAAYADFCARDLFGQGC
ncbi:MAG: tRNA pseudouridine(38-40) synthase TruA [Mariprofundaceae bacterium]